MATPEITERWQRVKEIFDRAVDADPEERSTLLDRTCGEDKTLRAEVESLLHSDAVAADFIENPMAEMPRDLLSASSDDDAAIGQQFGAYRIVREIGRGGLGTVYLAQRADEQFQKQVAIKLVRRGLDTEDILRRFRNERQILAQLEHPNIARLLDGGTTEDGLSYFVMEYVEGAPITTYCQARRLNTEERLYLFRKVCAAVTYAHQHLVIHRDLKPTNILVTAEGEPKLLDFGIAKVLGTEVELFTRTLPSLRMMTPEYASPEQIKGSNIATTSDVYALGVVLFELLTGQRPYRLTTHSSEEIVRAVTEQEPTRPSVAISIQQSEVRDRKTLRGDLDNIVLMALRKEPARRYSSVGQFSEDIRRHLEGRPVIARRDTWSYRSGKFLQRHKVGVAAAALIALTLVGGIIATTWEASRATREAAVAAQQRDRAERRFVDVRKLSNALLFDIAPKIERLEGSTEARQSLVRRALEYLDSLAKESAGDSQLQSELAAAYEKVGELQGAPRKPNLSDFSGAIASYEKARDIRKSIVVRQPADVENLRRFAADLSALSAIRWWTSDTSGSLEDSQAALLAYEKLLNKQPHSLELQLAAAEAQLGLGHTYYYNDQLAQVYPPVSKALATLESLRQRDPDNPEILRLLGRGYTILGMTLSWDGKQREGEEQMAKAFALYEPLAAKNPQDNVIRQGLLDTYLQSSQLFEDTDPARSFAILLKARELVERSVAADRANIQARQNLAKTYSRLGVIALSLGKKEETIAYLEKALVAFSGLEKSHPDRQTYQHDIGRVLMFLGQAKYQQRAFDDALATYAKAAATFEDIARSDPHNNLPVRKLATVHQYIGDVHRELAETPDHELGPAHVQAARENYRRALDILLRLQDQKALAEYDLKYLDELRVDLSKLEQH